MRNDKIKFLLCILFFAALAAITFRCAWGSDRVFDASDLNIGRLAFIKHLLPELFIGYYRSVELFGISGHSISLFNLLLSIMPLTFFSDVFYGLMLVVGSVAMVAFLRMWNRSWAASVFGALIAFWINSILLATGGHAYKMEVLAFSVIGLWLIEKAVRADRLRRSAGWSILAGLSVGIMMIEQQDVALLAGLFTGSYAVFRLIRAHARKVSRWAAVLLPIGIVALLLSGSTVLRSYEQNVAKATSVQGSGEAKWDFITQWSAVPEEWPDLIALGWGGWTSHHPKAPYWGKLGRSAEWEQTGQGFRNFKLTSNYLGFVPFMLGLFGLACAIRKRDSEEAKTILFWSVAGLLGFWLAFGKYSLLYKLFYQLPLFNNIRAPIKLLDNFQICLGIVAAYGLDCFVAGSRGQGAGALDGMSASSAGMLKMFWIFCVAAGGGMLLAGLKTLAFPQVRMTEFIKMGYGSYAEALVQNMSNAWLHAALMTMLCAGLIFVVWKGWQATKWVSVAFIVLIAADSLVLTSHHFKASSIAALKKGNGLIDYLKENQGNDRIFLVDQNGIYNQWLASDGPFHRLNLFNIWQMSRMPGDYQEFLATVGRNQIRLWELASIKYVTAPAAIMKQFEQNPELGKRFQPLLNYQVPTAQGMRQDVLMEFKDYIPRFALFHGWQTVPSEDQCSLLSSTRQDSREILLLEPAANLGTRNAPGEFQPLEAKVTKRKAMMIVRTETDAVVRFSQYFQPEWSVFVDGKRSPLLRVDYLCMGVAVPPGEHVVEFRCVNGVPKALFVLGVFALSLVASAWLLRPDRKAVE